MEDSKIIELLKNDPENGIELLIDTYGKFVCAVIKDVWKENIYASFDVEDCASDSFTDFFYEIDRFDPEVSSIKGYLYRIAKNNALDVCRKNKMNVRNVYLSDEEERNPITDKLNIEEELTRLEFMKQIFEEINALGEPDSTIVIMKYHRNEPSHKIAEELHLTVSNVDTRCHRALKKLRKRLKER